jgi:hypothetical protein
MFSLNATFYKRAILVGILGFSFFLWLSNRGELMETIDREWRGYYKTTREWGGDDECSQELVIYAEKILLRYADYEEVRNWQQLEVESSILYPDELTINLPNGQEMHITQPQPGHYLMGLKEVYYGGDAERWLGPFPMVKLRKGND